MCIFNRSDAELRFSRSPFCANYLESKGRRHSKRLAERKLKGLGFQTTPESRHLSGPDGKCNTPLIPPPPPPQLPSRVTPYATATLAVSAYNYVPFS